MKSSKTVKSMYTAIISFTCFGRVNSHCPPPECLSNINTYITVFTGILVYLDTDGKVRYAETKVFQLGGFRRWGTKDWCRVPAARSWADTQGCTETTVQQYTQPPGHSRLQPRLARQHCYCCWIENKDQVVGHPDKEEHGQGILAVTGRSDEAEDGETVPSRW